MLHIVGLLVKLRFDGGPTVLVDCQRALLILNKMDLVGREQIEKIKT